MPDSGRATRCRASGKEESVLVDVGVGRLGSCERLHDVTLKINDDDTRLIALNTQKRCKGYDTYVLFAGVTTCGGFEIGELNCDADERELS